MGKPRENVLQDVKYLQKRVALGTIEDAILWHACWDCITSLGSYHDEEATDAINVCFEMIP